MSIQFWTRWAHMMGRLLAATRRATRVPVIHAFLTALGLSLASATIAQPYAYLSKFGTFGTANGQFNVPSGVAIDPATRDIVVTDDNRNRIQIFSSSGTFLNTFGTAGSGNGQFKGAEGIAIDPVTRNIVVADTLNHRIQIFSPSGIYLSQFGSLGMGSGQLVSPWGIAIDPSNRNIVVSDSNRVQVFDSVGNFLLQFGAPGSANGQFGPFFPLGVAVDPLTRNILVADSGNNRVQIFASNGEYLSQFGSVGTADGQLRQPWAVAIDPRTNNILVLDYNNSRVQVFSASGGYLTKFGVQGPLDGQFFRPKAFAIDPTNANVVIADTGNYRMQIFANQSTQPPVTGAPLAVAIEYFHAAFGHHFITTIAAEISQLDAGVFSGWGRTGNSFNLYTGPGPGLVAVCRFFTTAYAPKSSHFYAPRGLGCEGTMGNANWQFEGDVAYTALPDAAGTCPTGASPVFRLYNNGQGGAPNHRFTIDPAVRSQMLAAGYIAEGSGIGVGMCSPN